MVPLDATVITPPGAGTSHEQFRTNATLYNDGEWGVFPSTHFYSLQDEAPALLVNTWDKAAVSPESHIFLQHSLPAPADRPARAGAPASSTATDGPRDGFGASPLILDAGDLTTVYLNRSFPGVANVNVHEFDGKPLLAFFGGTLDDEAGQIGDGWIWAYDQNYQQVGALSAEKLGVGADAHEFIMTGPKTGVVTAYQTRPWDLGAFSAPNDSAAATTDGRLLDSLFQEINLDTFDVLFEWRASDHIPLDMSFHPLGDDAFAPHRGWDYFHLTSVEKSPDGHYLVSGAHTHSLYEIDGRTGAVRWTLGGKANEFTELAPSPFPRSVDDDGDDADDNDNNNNVPAPLLTMAWQHHARRYPGTAHDFTVFDNHNTAINGWGCTANCSRGLHFTLDPSARTARLRAEFRHPTGLWTAAGGSVQVLRNGNVLVGWGRNPGVTEHTRDGRRCVLDLQLAPWRSPATGWRSLPGYRAFKADWASPAPTGGGVAPAVVATAGAGEFGGLTAWMSWNGATGVRGWALLASARTHDLDGPRKVVARAERAGFETKVWVREAQGRYLRAVALGEGGVILGASGVYDTRTGSAREAEYPVTQVEEPETPAEAAMHGAEVGGGEEKGEEKGGDAILDEAAKQDGRLRYTYHDTMTVDWTGSTLFFRLVFIALGAWGLSKLF